MKPLIFPKYGDHAVGENGLLASGTFTSAADIAGGLLVDAGGISTFDANGFHGNRAGVNYSGVSFTSTEIPDIADCSSGFTVVMEVQKGFFAEDYVGAINELQGLLRIRRVGGAKTFNHHNTTAGLLTDNAAVAVAAMSNVGMGDMVQVHFTGVYGWLQMYVNNYLVMNFADNRDGEIYQFDIAGNGASSFTGMQDHSVRNVAIYSEPMAALHGVTLGCYGDSQLMRGTYRSVSSGQQAILAARPDGVSDACSNGVSTYRNSGAVPLLHGKLNAAGIGVNGGRILNWCEGGAGIDVASSCSSPKTLSQTLDIALNGKYVQPDVPIVCIGTNDLGGRSLADLSDGTYAALLQTQIDRFINPKLVVVVNVCEKLTSDLSAKIAGLNASYARDLTGVVIADVYTATGGANLDPALLELDQIHWAADMHSIVADTIFKAIADNLVL